MTIPDRPRCVITGGGSGLGASLALRLADRGASTLLADLDLERLEATAEAVQARGGRVEIAECDVSDPAQVEALAAAAERALGGVDLLVNNAGVAASGQIGEQSLEDWRWLIEINLFGVIYGCHHFVPAMRARGSGHVLNTASAAGFAAAPQMGAYSVAKAGVVSLSETLRAEVRSLGVSVSVLCPTFFKSNLADTLRATDEQGRRMTRALLDRTPYTADDIAVAALDAVDHNRLYVLPQTDAKVMWRLKHTSPALFRAFIEQANRGGWIDRVRGAVRKAVRSTR